MNGFFERSFLMAPVNLPNAQRWRPLRLAHLWTEGLRLPIPGRHSSMNRDAKLCVPPALRFPGVMLAGRRLAKEANSLNLNKQNAQNLIAAELPQRVPAQWQGPGVRAKLGPVWATCGEMPSLAGFFGFAFSLLESLPESLLRLVETTF